MQNETMFGTFLRELTTPSRVVYWSEMASRLPSPLKDIALACKEVDDCLGYIKSSVNVGVYPSLDYFRRLYISINQIIRLVIGIANEKINNERDKLKIEQEYSQILKKMEEMEIEINKAYHQKKSPDMILPHLSIFSDFVHGQIKPILMNTIREVDNKLIKQFAKELLYQSGLRKREEDEDEEDKKEESIFDEVE